MSKKIRWAILGCGKIARKFAADLKLVKDAELIALGAREQSTADAFAKDFPAKYKHNSYEAAIHEMLEKIDINTISPLEALLKLNEGLITLKK